MGVVLDGRSAGGDRYLADELVSEKESDNHCRVIHRKEYLRDVYMGGEDGGIQ